jgi:hypothetical protein
LAIGSGLEDSAEITTIEAISSSDIYAITLVWHHRKQCAPVMANAFANRARPVVSSLQLPAPVSLSGVMFGATSRADPDRPRYVLPLRGRRQAAPPGLDQSDRYDTQSTRDAVDHILTAHQARLGGFKFSISDGAFSWRR